MTRRSLSKSRGPGRGPAQVAAAVVGATAGAVVAAIVLTGCSEASIPPPPPTEAEITEAMATYVDEQAANRAGMYPEIWEQVKFERFIAQDDAPLVLEACLSGFGVTSVKVERDGSMMWTEVSDGELQAAAVDGCSLSYPFDYEKSRVRTDAQLADIYRYETAFLVPCLQGQGMATGEPPSLDEFRDGAHRDLMWWNPYDTLDDRGVMWPTYDIDPTAYDLRVKALLAQCPPTSDGL